MPSGWIDIFIDVSMSNWKMNWIRTNRLNDHIFAPIFSFIKQKSLPLIDCFALCWALWRFYILLFLSCVVCVYFDSVFTLCVVIEFGWRAYSEFLDVRLCVRYVHYIAVRHNTHLAAVVVVFIAYFFFFLSMCFCWQHHKIALEIWCEIHPQYIERSHKTTIEHLFYVFFFSWHWRSSQLHSK